MRRFLETVGSAAYDVNAKAWHAFDKVMPGVRSTALNLAKQVMTHPKTATAALLLFFGHDSAAAMQLGPIVIDACFHVSNDDNHRHVALLDRGVDQGPSFNIDGFVDTECVTPLNSTAECEQMLNSTASLMSLEFCAQGACIPSHGDGVTAPHMTQNMSSLLVRMLFYASSNFRYVVVSDSEKFLPICLDDKRFYPGSDSSVCKLPDCGSNLSLGASLAIVFGTVGGIFSLFGLVVLGGYCSSEKGKAWRSKCWARLTCQEETQRLLDEKSDAAGAATSSACGTAGAPAGHSYFEVDSTAHRA